MKHVVNEFGWESTSSTSEIIHEILLLLPVTIAISFGWEYPKKKLLQRLSLPALWRSNEQAVPWLMKYCIGGYDTGNCNAAHAVMREEPIFVSNWMKKIKTFSSPFWEFCLNEASSLGYMEIVQFLFERIRTTTDGSYAMFKACENGHLEIVKFFHSLNVKMRDLFPINFAAIHGNLDIIKFLTESNPEEQYCNKNAMDYAATFGHLDVVKYLHQNRTEGCSKNAMDKAAEYGHLDVIEFLHENRTEGCTKKAMDKAVRFGYLDVVEFLHENRKEGCTAEAMDIALRNNNRRMVEYLYENHLYVETRKRKQRLQEFLNNL